ncbi:hypothetical protein [Nocardia sp. NPDC019395]
MRATESLPVRVRGESGIRPPTEWALPTPVQLELLLAAMRRWAGDSEHA